MKDDHMKNGQLKPAYNIQISTENQIVTCYSMHQRPGDTATLIPHLEHHKTQYQKQPNEAIADAGYGSEENYEYLKNNGVTAYVKYNMFHKEQKRSYKKDIFKAENLFYNKEQDFFVCPMGQRMYKIGIEVNHRLKELKREVRELLLSEEGRKIYKQRATEPESVFGQLKSNSKYNRFRMFGLIKNEIDLGLAFIAHNLKKMAKMKAKNDVKNSTKIKKSNKIHFSKIDILKIVSLVDFDNCKTQHAQIAA